MTFHKLANGLFFSFALSLLIAGCGSSVSLAPVSGTVTYNGQPLKQGTITFLPEKGPAASGKIVDGKIVDVGLNKAGDGAPLGKCEITVFSVDNPDADMYTPQNSIIPERYNNPKASGFTTEIKSGVTNEVKLELKD